MSQIGRKLTLKAEVKQGYDFGSYLREGAGQPVERSNYEISDIIYLAEEVTLEDVRQAIVGLRAALERKQVPA